MSDSPQVGKNVKFYLDCKIYVAWFIHKKKWSMVFLRGVVQLAFLVSSFYRSNINGYAIRLHITHHSAASLIGHFCTPDHTILHGRVLYSVPEYNASTIVTWERQTNRINRPGYRLFVQFFYRHLVNKHIKARCFTNLLHENLHQRVFSKGDSHLFTLQF